MIVEDVFYGVKCDRCGDMHEEFEYTFFSDNDSAWESASENDWIEDFGKHYCPDCYIMDEDSGDCKPKPEYSNHIKEFKKVFGALISSSVTLIEHEDYFEMKGTSYKGFGIDKEDCVKALLGKKLIEFKREVIEHFDTYHIKIFIEK